MNCSTETNDFFWQEQEDGVDADGTVTIRTANSQAVIRLRAVPLPQEVTELLDKHSSLIRDYDQALASRSAKLPECLSKAMTEFRRALVKAFADGGWPEETVEQLWSVGPRRCGPNVLLNRVPGFQRPALFQEHVVEREETSLPMSEDDSCSSELAHEHRRRSLHARELVTDSNGMEESYLSLSVDREHCLGNGLERSNGLLGDCDDRSAYDCLHRKSNGFSSSLASGRNRVRADYDNSFVGGFQLATLAGPLCQEPMMGVAFVVEQWDLDLSVEDPGIHGPLSGQIISTVKEGCRRAFQAQPQRLLCAMYSCNIQVTSEALRK